MSLKGFHIVFIILSCAITLGFGAWALEQGGAANNVMGGFSLAIGGALIVYGVWFLRKLKHVSAL